MSSTELLDQIRRLPAVDQLDLIEAIAQDRGERFRKSGGPGCKALDDLRQRMADAAIEAEEYYRTDPDVALWQALDGEPYHEYDERSNLDGGPGSENDQDPPGGDR